MATPNPTPQSERTWAVLVHLAPILGLFLGIGQILLPLLVLLLGPKDPFTQAHAKESLNGQISYTLYGLGLWLLALTVVGLFLALPLALALLVLAIWNMILGAQAAGRGAFVPYRFILRLIP